MARLSITYRTDRAPDEVTLGAFSQIAAKRRYGLEATKSEDPEVALFACFVELVGPAKAKHDPTDPAAVDPFDVWLQEVASFSLIGGDDPADPSPAETPSSDTSPGSPPTSE